MSLTTFLDNKAVRARFFQEFPKPRFNLKKEILAPPLTKHYGLVGTAFDYLMRFYIEHLNPRTITSKWVAELSMERMRELKLARFQGSIIEISASHLRKAEQFLSGAKAAYSNYLKSGKMNREVLRSALLLAQLDTYYRTGIIDETFGMIDEADIADLQKLVSIINPELFRVKELCILNPTFGEASILVGGADADLLIDNALIDIKTTSRLELKRDDFNEIIGYYILYRIGGIDDAPFEPKIATLGIYKSRYGELHTIPVKAIIDEAKIPSFIAWFKGKAAEAGY